MPGRQLANMTSALQIQPRPLTMPKKKASKASNLDRIEVPTLVIVGERDEGYHRAAEVMVARIPVARRVTIPGAGHIVNIEAAEAFNAAVMEFLRGLPD